ncbi:MAG: UDP-N-acetylglucosamine diphosphorylase/glucosamine-1-phosphate N-acetyltransferase [Deltaproteobacteria bacterium RIFCSPLOWO2_12_55_13]|nr:MAG: UDP-N-acetylglucosamine diphosphorylase/glucosamine-1-phosphate N-acetyltransferase [Deltaproteobacteria bacterium RIFCSPLOWO2_12_55_13]
MKDLGVIILAAGEGKRMKSGRPKVVHSLGGKPLLAYVLETARRLKPKKLAVVVGHGAEEVKKECGDSAITWVHQEKQLGTGHAVGCTGKIFEGFSGEVLILSGDVPLISKESLLGLLRCHREQNAVLTFVSASLAEPAGYGRVLRDDKGSLLGIVEERDAGEKEKQIREINAGIYAASARFLFDALKGLSNRNQQGEYYLPDVVGVALKNGQTVGTVHAEDPREILGINTREELAFMERTLQERINRKWMESGVTFQDPQTTYIEEGVRIGQDTVIGPNTHLLGHTVVGERCRIDGNAYVTNAKLGNQVHLRFSVVLTDCRIEEGAVIGPFAHLRPGTSLGRGVHIGNFVETKEATIGAGTRANHLTYLGDVTVGRETNIGAGTITCNYDGFQKYRSAIGDRVQVGSDSTLVAPVRLGDDVYVATATTVRHDVPAGGLVYNERSEKVREGWTEQKRKKMKKVKV